MCSVSHVARNFLHNELVRESIDYVRSFDFLNFQRRVLLDELINMHVSATDTYLNLISLLNFNIDAFLTELVHALRFTEEQDVHFFALRKLVDEA